MADKKLAKLAVKLDEKTEESFRIILVKRRLKIQDGLVQAVADWVKKWGKRT